MSAARHLSPDQFFHGSMNRIEPGDSVRVGAMPPEYGKFTHNYFTTDRHVAEDAAGTRTGRPGFIHAVEPTGEYEIDRGEKDSFRSTHPLRVISATPHQADREAQ